MGSKNYSSWSLRPWLFLRKLNLEFQEQMIYFDAVDSSAQIAKISPSARVPVLIDGELKIWDSLAICEYAAQKAGRGLPMDTHACAVARAVSAEMHAGFQTLREQCPMNVRQRNHRVPQTAQLLTDIRRIDGIWSDCRQRFGTQGDWLFGEFCIADAMFAPVAFRFQTYGAQLGASATTYLNHVLADPTMREWSEASQAEGHPLPRTDHIGRMQSP